MGKLVDYISLRLTFQAVRFLKPKTCKAELRGVFGLL